MGRSFSMNKMAKEGRADWRSSAASIVIPSNQKQIYSLRSFPATSDATGFVHEETETRSSSQGLLRRKEKQSCFTAIILLPSLPLLLGRRRAQKATRSPLACRPPGNDRSQSPRPGERATWLVVRPDSGGGWVGRHRKWSATMTKLGVADLTSLYLRWSFIFNR